MHCADAFRKGYYRNQCHERKWKHRETINKYPAVEGRGETFCQEVFLLFDAGSLPPEDSAIK